VQQGAPAVKEPVVAAYPSVEPKETHPLNLGFAMALVSFALNVVLRAIGLEMEHGLGRVAVVCLIAGATVVLAGHGNKALVAFIAANTLSDWSLSAALLPAVLFVSVRVVRRARTLRRAPRLGFWTTLQAWAGWTR
jgi:hypothetical protein